jgi:hypothetical protein
MILQEDLVNFFQGLSVPKKLLALLKFDTETSQRDYFSSGFEFSLDKEKVGLKTYSDSKKFLNSIYEFAKADGGGSSYAFWLKDGNSNLELAPIVVFGSEGGFHIVAKNLDGLLQILTFDSEPMIDWETVYYYKGLEDFEPSKKSKEYRNWLKKECAIDPIDNADAIVEEAQKEHKKSFNAWVGEFYKG